MKVAGTSGFMREGDDLTEPIVVRASTVGAALDTDLMRGGGTDDTAVIQGILDLAREGRALRLELDGPARVGSLRVWGNTTIEGVGGGVGADGPGFFLADDSPHGVLRNARPSRDAIVDRDIVLRGLFLNGNRAGQTPLPGRLPGCEENGTFRSIVQFFGVEDLLIEDVTLWNARAFGACLANVARVLLHRVTIDQNFGPFPGDAPTDVQRTFLDGIRSNLDGVHVNGPASRIEFRDLRIRTEDDGIAFNANDMGADDMTVDDAMGPFVGQGPITDVLIDTVHFDDSLQGIRLLSSTERIDRVTLRRLTGSIRHGLVLLSNYLNPGPGDFGSIELDDVRIDAGRSATWRELYADTFYSSPAFEAWDVDEQGLLPLISLNAPIERLRVTGMSTTAIDERPLIRLGPRARVGRLEVTADVQDVGGRAVILRHEPGGRAAELRLVVTAGPSPETPSLREWRSPAR